MEKPIYTAFSGAKLVSTGELREMLKDLKSFADVDTPDGVLIFNDETGEQVDFDLRGTVEEALARLEPVKPKTGRGRPALGVVCREVTLLPRHWEWLERQQKNVSATLRRLVDEAVRNEPASAKARRAVEAADRELWVLAGNLPGCEEASRSLYARDFARFREYAKNWPADISGHLSRLVRRAE